jgi:dTDP-4-dehydrorhamnose 3,5-epimerase
MKTRPLKISGAFEIINNPILDERGSFTRTFSEDEFGRLGLQQRFIESSASFNRKRFTLRGLHYQSAPFAEVKLVTCLNGNVFDVVVDLRTSSATFGQWDALELSSEKMNSIYIPTGCAHGFLTLVDGCILQYSISARYSAEHAQGIIWNDPVLNIAWPSSDAKVMSSKDRKLPKFDTRKKYF